MTSLFGVPMNDIMIALLILLGVAAATVGWVVLRNRVLFLIGVRNIPRRRAQTTLIVLGLMLSTLIIAAAFSIGDTVHYSITNQGFDHLHSIDETVQAQAGSSDAGGANAVVSPLPIPQPQADGFAQAFRAMAGIDGAVPVIRGIVPVTDQRSGLAERSAVVAGSDPAQMAGFPDIQSTGGAQLLLANLGPDEVYVNSSLAAKLDAKPGD
ncbi:MAG: ABC transporter permease, partial [Dehalococcoidia bacterium]